MPTVKVLMNQIVCADWPNPSVPAYVISTKILRIGLYKYPVKKIRHANTYSPVDASTIQFIKSTVFNFM